MKNKKTSAMEAFLALSDEEKERQCREFDKEFIADTFKPLTPAQRALWERAKRRGRPTVGQGAKVISLSVERQLLKEADAWAKAQGISRAELVARGLRALLAKKSRRSKAA
jgi:S-adenosylmethionine:diacylglycerol 3-amino-3-carboxypropyl transferase